MAEKEGLRERGGEGRGEEAGIAAFGHRRDETSWPAFAPRVGSGQTLRL